ncbi:Gfo/Idh/MocA family protein [Paenibacillus aquistagni]|uniref:Gfo/Idh/MocA family protein n=1 Tax=Paenibacillus aquistagni TaxID=1852522 RepID=UPI00145BE586|nr:Gfo/Idh/MocA family oxidoreductase [Paenibacillus aquistagni]NMM52317.1 Gfo/Idh/MocA family oxidoreductase [Paenibacillus aquistagni]
MKKKKWGVGIIGAGGWGGLAHAPALKVLEAYEAKAVTGTRLESAQRAAELLGIERYYIDASEMARQSDIDIAAVTVKVPEHDRLIRAVLEAGKHVYCEWPLARTTAEAEELLVLAKERGVQHIVGLQARANSNVCYMRELVADGQIGQVIAVNIAVTLPVFPTTNGVVDQAHVYLLDASNGANQLTVGAAHILDAVEYMVAPFIEVSAALAVQYPDVTVLETGETVQADAPDHVLISGKLEGGALVAAQIVNGGALGFTLRVIGTNGELVITPRDGLMFQMDRLNLSYVSPSGEAEILEAPEPDVSLVSWDTLPGPGYHVAHQYIALSKQLAGETAELPDFAQAVRLHRLMDAIRQASQTGIRQAVE